MSDVLRTRTTGETAGFMKVLVEARGDRILAITSLNLACCVKSINRETGSCERV
jgi:hypothetical protein